MHTYILISLLSLVRGYRVPRRRRSLTLSAVEEQQMHLREELIQNCILCRGIIHIQMHDNDSQINPWAEPQPVGPLKVFFFFCFFPADLYLDSGLISQLIPWCLLTPQASFLFFFFSFPPSGLSCRKPVRQSRGRTRPTFVLTLTRTRVLDSSTRSIYKNAALIHMLI